MSKTDRTDGVYLLHIVDALQDILDFLQGKKYSDFVASKLLINADVRSFEIVGEATKNLSEDFRNANSEIDWKGMAGFRDVLIHQYFGIDLANVWDAYVHFVPDTLPKLQALDSYIQMRKILG